MPPSPPAEGPCPEAPDGFNSGVLKRWQRRPRRVESLGALVASFGLSLGCAKTSAGQADPAPVRTVTFELEARCPLAADACWEHFTADVGAWWDHTFSEQPHALVLDARVGGSFYESFDATGNGAEHARVIYAQRPQMLRLDGPLGLSGLAVQLVHELRFEAQGEQTRVALRVQMTGAVDDDTVDAVRGVWAHFLLERYQPYVEARAAEGAR